MYKLNFAKPFHEDVKFSVEYIRRTLQAPVAAQRLKDEITKAYKKIREMPLIYPVVPDAYLATIGFRFTMVKNYMLFYTVEKKQVNIIRFLYGRRDWINILRNTDTVD